MEYLICVIKVNKRTKRMSLRVNGNGVVEITKPRRASDEQAKEFARSHQKWIQERLIKIEETPEDIRTNNPEHYKKHREKARNFLEKRVPELNQAYQFIYRSIAIRNQKSRWGSCSVAGNLNFNYKIVFLPHHLQDYLIVHELCHTKQMNHSSAFWSLVEKTIPEYKLYRRELRRYSW